MKLPRRKSNPAKIRNKDLTEEARRLSRRERRAVRRDVQKFFESGSDK